MKEPKFKKGDKVKLGGKGKVLTVQCYMQDGKVNCIVERDSDIDKTIMYAVYLENELELIIKETD